MNQFDLGNRAAIVTGGAKGIGAAIARRFLQSGARVAVWDIDAERLAGTAEELRSHGAVETQTVDVTDPDAVKTAAARAIAAVGAVDILVNNATSLPDAITQPGPFWEKPLAMASLLDVGLRSHYVAAWHAAPLLLANGEGLIVNTSSFGGRIYMHGPAYGAGKAAVDKMSHDMAHDFKPHGVAVVSIWLGLL